MAQRTGWIAHYLYQGADGEIRSMTTRLLAASRREAVDRAAEAAPAKDFVVQIHAESDEQFLGTVRGAIAQTLDVKPFDPADYDEDA